MNLIWTENAWEDYLYWQTTDKKLIRRINTLIKEIKRSPFEGIGKPEPLKFDLAGKWSRKINDEHRLIYEILDMKIVVKKKWVAKQELIIYQCRYHYS